MKATIIILDYMKARQIVENVETLQKQQVGFDFKIVVIDNSCNEANAATLRTLEKFPNVVLRINDKNLGYPKAHNEAGDLIEGEYVLIVNPDIVWKEQDSVAKLVRYMDDNPDIGILGPRQINDGGETAMTVRAFPRFYLQVARRTFLRNLPVLKKKVVYDEMRHLDYDKTQDVDWLQSSCVIIRKKLWDITGGFNDKYFIFMSDVEICFEAWKNDYRVVYYPEVRVWADGRRASAGGFKKFFQSWVLRQHVMDSLKYRFKHFFDKNPRYR